MAHIVHWLATIPHSRPFLRFWSGDYDLTFDGETYQGRNFVNLSPAEAGIGSPNTRLVASFSVVDPTLRAAFLQDLGPVMVTIEYIYSADGGLSYQIIPGGRKFVGRMSNPVIKDGIYRVELETYGGDVDRGRPLRWSHEDQLRRYPGDKGLEFMRELEEGVEVKWPP